MHRIYQSSLTRYSSSNIGVFVSVEDVASVNYCPVADQPVDNIPVSIDGIIISIEKCL